MSEISQSEGFIWSSDTQWDDGGGDQICQSSEDVSEQKSSVEPYLANISFVFTVLSMRCEEENMIWGVLLLEK